jgi:hypothetical protein
MEYQVKIQIQIVKIVKMEKNEMNKLEFFDVIL